MNTRTATVVAMLVFTLSGCGGSPGEPSSAEELTLRGSIVRLSGAPCDSIAPTGEDIEVAGRQVTVRDGDGDVVGTTDSVSGAHEWRGPTADHGCRLTADYEVSVRRADFYTVELEPFDEPTDPVSYRDLEAEGFRFNLKASSDGVAGSPD